jgi:hypothetical protein
LPKLSLVAGVEALRDGVAKSVFENVSVDIVVSILLHLRK